MNPGRPRLARTRGFSLLSAHRASTLLMLGLALFSGCAPDFIDEWEVTKPRHLAAELRIEGDSEGRTRPRPGETFSLRFYLMSPRQPQARLSLAMELCFGALLTNGALACLQEIPASEVPLQVEPYEGNDQLVVSNLTVPAVLDELPPPLDELDRFGLFGTVCVDGDVERVPGKDVTKDATNSIFRCVNNEGSKYPEALPFTLAVLLDRDGPGALNHNPRFACDETAPDSICNLGVRSNGEQVPGAFVLERPKAEANGAPRTLAWPDWDDSQPLPWTGCVDTELPQVHAGSDEHKLRIRFDPSDREQFERFVQVNGKTVIEGRREELIVSHALTTDGGELGGYKSAVVYTDPDDKAEVEIKYTPPKQGKKAADIIPDSGRLVRFYFALRDRRGGVDFTTRELCLVPPVD